MPKFIVTIDGTDVEIDDVENAIDEYFPDDVEVTVEPYVGPEPEPEILGIDDL